MSLFIPPSVSSSNLAQTGQQSIAFTTGLSGFMIGLISAASAGVSSINGLSGVLTLQGAGNISASASAQSIIISGDTGIYANFALKTDLFTTGSNLNNRIDILSGYVNNQDFSTGRAAILFGSGIGINLSGNLTSSGQALLAIMTGMSGQNLNSLSGWVDNIFVHRTGSELISGVKTFTDLITTNTGINFTISNNVFIKKFGVSYLKDLNGGVFLGNLAGNALTGLTSTVQNVGVGTSSLTLLQVGDFNNALGGSSLSSLITGFRNTAMGGGALVALNAQDSSDNTAVGSSSLSFLLSGSRNVGIGALVYAGVIRQSGNDNIFIGYNAGTGLSTGNSNLLIGTSVQTPTSGSSNTLNIGDAIYATGIYPVGTQRASVGINVRNPLGALHINGPLYLSGVTTSTTANIGSATLPATAVGFITINITGGDFKIPYYNV